MFVLPVRLTMVTNNPVSVGRGLLSTVTSSNVSVEIIVEAVEETLFEVHVTDGVDVHEFNRARYLSIASSPVVLNSFHVHLVDHNHDLITLSILNLGEEVFITLVNEDLFEFREENITTLDEPVHVVSIHTFLREGRGTNERELVSVVH